MMITKDEILTLKKGYEMIKVRFFNAGLGYAGKLAKIAYYKEAPDFDTFNKNMKDEKDDYIDDFLSLLEHGLSLYSKASPNKEDDTSSSGKS